MAEHATYSVHLRKGVPRILAELSGSHPELYCAFDEEGFPKEETSYHNILHLIAIFSRRYPKTLFIVDYTGDIEDYTGRAYIRDGKSYEVSPIITWPRFDPAKLK